MVELRLTEIHPIEPLTPATKTRGARGRYVSKNGLPPHTDLSNPVYFDKGRYWIKTPDGSRAPYVPRRTP